MTGYGFRSMGRTTLLPERRRMMQLWGDCFDGLKEGAKVIHLDRT